MPTATNGLPTIDDIRQIWRANEFDYIELHDAKILIGPVAFGWSSWVAVIGDPDNASYEWVAQVFDRGQHERRMSNHGWGGTASCLRDALNALEEYL